MLRRHASSPVLKCQTSSPTLRRQTSSPALRRQTSSPALKHQVSSLVLRHQVSSPKLRHQAWLTTHAKNLEDLTKLIFLSKRSNRFGLSISSSIVSPSERSIGLVCPFHLALWKKENFTFGARRSLSWFRRSDPIRVIYLPWSTKGSWVREGHVEGNPPHH